MSRIKSTSLSLASLAVGAALVSGLCTAPHAVGAQTSLCGSATVPAMSCPTPGGIAEANRDSQPLVSACADNSRCIQIAQPTVGSSPFVTVDWTGADLGEANAGTCDQIYAQNLRLLLIGDGGQVLDSRALTLASGQTIGVNTHIAAVRFSRVPRPASGRVTVQLVWENLTCSGTAGGPRDEQLVATLTASQVNVACR